jgi:hypothetical protein
MTGRCDGYNPVLKPRRRSGIELLTGATRPTMTNVPWQSFDFDAFLEPMPVQSPSGEAE